LIRNLFNRVFVRNILIISSLIWLIFYAIVLISGVKIPLTEIFSSFLICVINFAIGSFIFVFSLDKPNKVFLIFSLGSIGIRLFVIIILVLVLIAVFKFQKNYFILSLLGFYFTYLSFEIYLLNKVIDKNKG
jgi:hypothetical protein